MLQHKQKLIIFIPAYNEEKTITEVIRKIPKNLAGVEQEIIVVDDGSTDNTVKKVQSIGVKVISHHENLGLGKTFSTIVRIALEKRADVVITIDADLQFNPAEIPKLANPIIQKKADFVTGTRFVNCNQQEIPMFRLLGNKLIARFISWVCKRKFTDVSCGFRVYSRKALFYLNIINNFTYTHEVILTLSFKGLRMLEKPIKVKYYTNRKSHVTGNIILYILKTLRIIFQVIIDYKPFHVFGLLGITLFTAGVLLDISMLFIYFNIGQFTPYKIIGVAGIVFNFLGIISFFTGVYMSVLSRIRRNQEESLYYQKKNFYD